MDVLLATNDETLRAVLETIGQLSTELVFLFMTYLTAHYLVAITLSLDLIIILLTLFASRYLHRHLIIKPMGEHIDYTPPFSDRQQDRIYKIFLRGLEEEQKQRSDARRVRRPPP